MADADSVSLAIRVQSCSVLLTDSRDPAGQSVASVSSPLGVELRPVVAYYFTDHFNGSSRAVDRFVCVCVCLCVCVPKEERAVGQCFKITA